MHGYKKGDTSTVDTVGLFITWTRPQMYFLWNINPQWVDHLPSIRFHYSI